MSYGTTDAPSALDDHSMEEGAVYAKSVGRVQEPKIPIVPRVFLYIFGGLLILAGIGGIGGTIVDTIIYSDSSDLVNSFYTVPALAVVMMWASGIVICISTTHVKRSNALAWCLVHWACFWSMLLLIAAMGSAQLFVVSLSLLSSVAVFQLIVCFIWTFTCTVPFLKKQ